MTDTSAAQDAPQSQVAPLYYRSIAPLNAQLHKDFKIRPAEVFDFATQANTIPLTVPEFAMVSRHYPILLLGDDLVPTAALALEPGENLFVSPEGRWDRGAYVPAYIRRYPFILLGGDDTRLTLGMDTEAASDKPDARPLFNPDGKETDTVTQAMEFCHQFHNAFLFTRDFSQAIKKADIVVECQIEIEPTPGQKVQLGSFKRVDEEKFKALPDETFLEWRKIGFLHPIYFLLQSMNNWEILLAKKGMLG